MSEKKKNKTKSLITLAIYHLMLSKTYDEISVKDICEKAGVSRMSFYRYYSKKDDIFVTFCDEKFEDFYSTISKKESLSFEDFAYEIFALVKNYARQMKILVKADKSFLLFNQFNSYANYILRSYKNPMFVTNSGNPALASFIAGGLYNVVMYWVNDGMKESPEEMAKYLVSVFGN